MTHTLNRWTTPARWVAVAALVALAGSAAQVALAQPASGPGAGPGMGMGPMGHAPMMMGGHRGGPGMDGPMMGGMGGPMMGRMLDSVGASADQKTRVQQIMQAARDDLRKQHEGARGQREQMMQLFTQPTIDARAVEALRQQMLAQHDQASRRMTQAMLDAAAVLTPEQRQKLAERGKQRRDMMERHRRERQGLEAPKS